MRVPGFSFSLAIGNHRSMNSGNMYMTTTVASLDVLHRQGVAVTSFDERQLDGCHS